MTCTRHPIRVIGILAVLVLAAVPLARADTLYSNPPDYGVNSFDAYTSQNDGTNSYAVFSSFQLAQTSSVTSVTWQGAYVSTVLADNPPPPDATSFSLAVYSSSGGLPNSLVAVQVIPVSPGGVQETFNSNTPFSLDFTTPTTAAIYDYSTTLAAPIVLSGGTTYFLSVVANTTNPVGTPYWGWNSGGLNGPTYASYSTDAISDLSRTFTLFGQAVPEPSSVVLLLLGVGGIQGLRRGRRPRSRDTRCRSSAR